MRRIRGRRIGFIFQEPMVALDPVYTIGAQIAETLAVHDLARGRAARTRAIELLAAVRMPDPARRAREYPHQLSGGLRQRAMIALALSAEPSLVIADEPTTALDVTVQAEILDLLRDMRREFNLSLLLITHDLGVVAEMADRVAVMYAGRIVEQAGVKALFENPAHPYTRGLLASIPGTRAGKRLVSIPGNVPAIGQLPPGCAFAPRCVDRFERLRRGAGGDAGDRGPRGALLPQRGPSLTPLVEVRNLVKEFPMRGSWFRRAAPFRAVDDISFSVEPGETFGLVGESGCGKTTTGRCLLRLIEPTSGDIRIKDLDVRALSGGDLRRARRHFQIVFQDPYSSLNPRMRVGAIVEEPLIIHRIGSRDERQTRVRDLFELVGLSPSDLMKYPHEFSGGQRQRIGMARALALEPSLIVADEPVSALDVSVQAQVVNLLLDLQQRLGLTYVFIAHDLRLVRQICDRVAVMYRGRLVELAPAEALFTDAVHPYTKALLSAIPRLPPGARLERIPFDAASFERLPLREVAPGHFAGV